MGDLDGPPLRRAELLASLTQHGVEFVLVGGQVGVVHEAERPTNDLDVCVRWTRENLERMGEVLVDLDAGLRIEGMDEAFVPPHRDARFLDTMKISTWRTAGGDLDILRAIPSPTHDVSYDELFERAEWFSIDGHRVLVASLDDVISSKEVLDRASDRDALPELRTIRDREAAERAPQPPEPPGLPSLG